MSSPEPRESRSEQTATMKEKILKRAELSRVRDVFAGGPFAQL